MKTVGIICEYNPLHLGHKKQMDAIRASCGGETAIVCLMSGNFVQRGVPAILDKSLRAQAAVLCGADLVLELPVPYALSSAEGFASGGVGILGGFCDALCFGVETADASLLERTAQALLSPEFPPKLKAELQKGASFPAARQAALTQMGLTASILETPNNILAVEYCKAILAQNLSISPMPVFRGGSYHDQAADAHNPSATAVRKLILQNRNWGSYVPEAARSVFQDASLHTLEAGERAILAKLRTMSDAEFEAIPYGSEGLWRKLMHASRSCATLEEIIDTTKSKRYTRTRIDRMILCAFLGLAQTDLQTPAPYTRVLALNDRGRAVLKAARQTGIFLNAGQIDPGPYGQLEQRIGSLYGLFATRSCGKPDSEASRRVFYHKEL